MITIKRISNSLASRSKTYASVWQTYKKIYFKKYKNLGSPEVYIWIFGCQRSGTTLLERIFRSDLSSAVFGEFSKLTINSSSTVLKSLPEIDKELSSCNARYAVVRPLFESDRAVEILQTFPKSKAIWLFRDFSLVVSSMLNKWGDQFFEISRKNETDKHGYWRMESMLDEINEESGACSSIEDKYALYWVKRNAIFFNNDLHNNSQIVCLNYEQLVMKPEYCIDTFMKRSGESGIWNGFKTDAHVRSLKKSVKMNIAPEIVDRCNLMYSRLTKCSRQFFPDM
ncbi:MAG: sulfotransferase domain-containing protein [Arenicellales bacterium]